MKIVNIFGFNGSYGGDQYEEDLANQLSRSDYVDVVEYRAVRHGGAKTFFSLIKLLAQSTKTKGNTIRPFGLPIYKKNMSIIVHHFDQSGSPIYTKIIELIDLLIILFTHKILKIKFIFVSHYWRSFFKERYGINGDVIYNVPKFENNSSQLSKKHLSEKYKLPLNSDWIFFGSIAEKKGAKQILSILKERFKGGLPKDICLICSGRGISECDPLHLLWIDESDYHDFLSACSLVVANSQFEEGWCRLLHEASVAGTSIVGSGAGGMGELLSIVNKRASYSMEEICDLILSPDLRPLPDNVAVNNIEKIQADQLLKFIEKLK